MTAGYRVEMDSLQSILRRRGLQSGGPVQQFIDNEVLRRNAPYMPFQTGGQIRSGILGTRPGSGLVIYQHPAAKYLYYGKLMVGAYSRSAWAKSGEPKVLTNKDLTYHGGPMRGAKFFERMKADHKGDILREAAGLAGGRAE